MLFVNDALFTAGSFQVWPQSGTGASGQIHWVKVGVNEVYVPFLKGIQAAVAKWSDSITQSFCLPTCSQQVQEFKLVTSVLWEWQ